MPFPGRVLSRFGRFFQRAPASQATQDSLRLTRTRAAANVAKIGAAGGATALTAQQGSKLVKAWKGEHQPFTEEVRETPEGTLWRDETGGTHFIPNISFLDAHDRLNQGEGANWQDLVYEGGPSEETQQTSAIAEAITDPLTLLAIGAVIVGVLYVRGRSK